ncbi:MAG: hypothetical protein CL912_11730 [Deltaproteobacteria bacterium]|nr:hypothetical protein [Deltaproteobacteria bacterium]
MDYPNCGLGSSGGYWDHPCERNRGAAYHVAIKSTPEERSVFLISLNTMNTKMVNMVDSTMGKAQRTHGQSLRTFLASVTVSGAILGLGLIGYIFIKLRFPKY